MTNMKKNCLLILLLCAVVALSGCSSLVKTDSAVDGLQTILTVNGEHVNKQNFQALYNYNLYNEQYYAQMMAQFGLSEGSVDSAAVLQSTAQSAINSLVLAQKARENGFDQFTDEENAALDAEAQEQYAQQLETVKTTAFPDSEPTQEELETYAANMGYTLESIRSSVETSHITNRLRESVTASVTVDDAALQAALEEKIAQQKESFEGSANALNTAANGAGTLYYIPEGYRLISVYTVQKPSLDDSNLEAAAQAKEQFDALYARLAAGETPEDSTATQYRMNADSTVPSADAVAAAMALTEKGAAAQIETDTAYQAVVYVDDIEAHTVTLDEVHDALYAEVLENAQNDAYTAAVQSWVDAADIQLFLDRLQ